MTDVTLIFGPGWLGTQFQERIPGAILSTADIADAQQVDAELERVKPKRVINCAGKTGRPNVDGCERDPAGTYRTNVAGAVLLATACHTRGLHMTHMGSGCVYEGDNGGAGFAEDDAPNFYGSLYSRTKALSEAALRDLGTLQLRIRMPLSSTPNPRNLLTKLLGYSTVFNADNSVTILEDFWRPALTLIERGETGVWNLVNEGIEAHGELLSLYQERVDPTIRFVVAPRQVVEKRLAAGRSNCVLSTEKLRAEGLGMPPVSEALPRLVDAYGAAMRAAAP